MNPLFTLCCQQSPDPETQRATLEALLDAGADLHAVDKNGVTALHHAVRFRNPGAVEVLLRRGAKVNQTCARSGSTALHRAATSTGAPGTAGKNRQARAIVALLLEFGADPAIRNRTGKQAADYVRDKEVLRLLAGES